VYLYIHAQELLLLGLGDAAITGTWAERAAWLFVQLAQACELEAVLISGFWKGDKTIRPGKPIVAHNHCWAGGLGKGWDACGSLGASMCHPT
jgi:hypothetical protein